MSERKIDAIDQFEIDIIEAGLAVWKREKGASKLSRMTSAWRTMTSLALTAPPAPRERPEHGTEEQSQ